MRIEPFNFASQRSGAHTQAVRRRKELEHVSKAYSAEPFQPGKSAFACTHTSSPPKGKNGASLKGLQRCATSPAAALVLSEYYSRLVLLELLQVQWHAIDRVPTHRPGRPGLLNILWRVCIAPHKHGHEHLQQQQHRSLPGPDLDPKSCLPAVHSDVQSMANHVLLLSCVLICNDHADGQPAFHGHSSATSVPSDPH